MAYIHIYILNLRKFREVKNSLTPYLLSMRDL